MTETREKVIVVLTCVRDADRWTRAQVLENAPDWIDSALGERAAREDSGRHGDPVLYYFEDPTVYVSLEEFDDDRAERMDHFTPEQLDLWRPPLTADELAG